MKTILKILAIIPPLQRGLGGFILFLLSTAYCLLPTSSLAQDYQWAKGIGGTSWDYGYSIAVDDMGNVYVTGVFGGTSGGTADFDPGPGTANLTSAGNIDIFFAKYNSSGDYIWAKRLGGIGWDDGRSIALDGTGNVYITGWFMGTVDFDPGPDTAALTSVGRDIFFAKYSSSGDYIWAKRVGGTWFEEGSSIALDDMGNVYITGTFEGTADFDPGPGTANLISAGAGFDDIFFAKYSSSGDYLWAKSIGSTLIDQGLSIALDGMGNVYITGYFWGTADFDPGSSTADLTSNGIYDIFFAKYNSSGNYIWAKRVGGPSCLASLSSSRYL